MIVSFSVANFRSFSSEETFSLIASQRPSEGSNDDHAVAIPNSKASVLRTGVIYGANGAGKSNLFKALRYMRSMVLMPRNKKNGTGREAFRLGEEGDSPSSFDLQFIAENKLYRFGFKANDHKITEEWLVQILRGKEKIIYERITGEDGKVAVDLNGVRKPGAKLSALATIGGPQNQTFISTIRATLDPADITGDFKNALNWFSKTLCLIAPNESIAPLGHLLSVDPEFKDFAGKFLQSSSTGVEHIEVTKKEITEEELKLILPEDMVSKILEDIREGEEDTVLVDRGGGNELLIDRTDGNHYYSITVQASHHGKNGDSIRFELNAESDGTQRLLNLMPALHHFKKRPTVYFIDEIDRSMHPILVWKFMDFFLKACEDGQRQIIVTTHESNLLDLDLLRRDEIWFAEKNWDSSTKLYSLADFKVRKDLEIRKHYLQGRFGAVPFLGNVDQLLEEGI